MDSSAFNIWNREESIEETEARIHDGVPKQHLNKRASGYINTIRNLFPEAIPREGSTILEVGSGLGYVMEAAHTVFSASKVVGLDVAKNMIEKARSRLDLTENDNEKFEFIHYDGITIPCEENLYDFIYSVACIQHIPKEYAYNLMGQLKRIIKPNSNVIFHVPAFTNLHTIQNTFPFEEGITQQINGVEGHWHFFYALEELYCVLQFAYQVVDLSIKEFNGDYWVCFTK